MKTKHSVLMVFLLCVSVSLISGGSESDGIILEARIVTEFTLAPITINLEGVDANGAPVYLYHGSTAGSGLY